ncbi:GNAT family N-acetyltransferase [Pedobacter sp. HMF7647]|uniref:GNAT family N-acetyltransferase n=1 Tax=Hufsiella arboris TaxID=2695275 RepID=A0A7K1YDU8_9SPHI|nr:GNAT family N-acetyltransferase [Hufsiella arboris]MXV52765.1 GNAT family N-acetyltransferase [Hufsiella arboris]
MIKFISGEDTLHIRNQVLRNNLLTPQECIFSGDDEAGSFHLGYFDDEKLVCIATFHKQNIVERPELFPQVSSHLNNDNKNVYRLRGMATLPEYRGKGIGNQLVNFAIVYLRGQKVNDLWCDARKVAYRFYKSLGFEFISEEFEIPNIGPHKVMYLKIQ